MAEPVTRAAILRQMGAGEPTPFASKTLAEHLARGAIGAGAISLAIMAGGVEGVWWALPAALGLGAAALIAFRGCPICWTAGLVETASRSWRSRREAG